MDLVGEVHGEVEVVGPRLRPDQQRLPLRAVHGDQPLRQRQGLRGSGGGEAEKNQAQQAASDGPLLGWPRWQTAWPLPTPRSLVSPTEALDRGGAQCDRCL